MRQAVREALIEDPGLASAGPAALLAAVQARSPALAGDKRSCKRALQAVLPALLADPSFVRLQASQRLESSSGLLENTPKKTNAGSHPGRATKRSEHALWKQMGRLRCGSGKRDSDGARTRSQKKN